MPIPAILLPIVGSVVGGLLQKAFGTSDTPAAPPAPQALGKDDFLRLLTVQLQNQDPLNPMSNENFLAQTAQFSSLEQLQNVNTTLQQLAAQQAGTSGISGAAGLLGRVVTVNGSPVTLDGGSPASVGYILPTSSAAVYLQVVDASGTAVRTMAVGQQGAGPHQIVFDGLDDQGRRLPAGSYTYRVAATDATGQTIPGAVTGGGQVTGINVDNGQLVLLLGDRRVPLASVVGVQAQAAQ